MKKVGVVLSGCGVYDGSEIHEAVLTLLALDRKGFEIVCLAPDAPQADVVDHRTGSAAPESRNILAEAARIARGKVRDLAGARPDELDALVFPGGFGAAKNLCTFAVQGPDCSVNPDVRRLVLGMHAAGKPLCALCIAPALLAKVLGDAGVRVTLTIGNDPGTAEALRKAGALHQDCPADGCVVDEANRVVTTPAYMRAGRISEAADGIDAAISALARLIG
ncbi:MAG: isoprenoid biosynthesis glyoxalase ElbB [Acidobacteria bacterium]|nr:isoprenoid biosynthesis glyoxalase ElbB [Acidobacteriota bacterium]